MFKLVSTESSNICFFFLFQNKDSLVPQMGNVMAIGLTPSRTGIVIGRLLNAQLRHMSVRAAWRLKLSLFWPQIRCREVALFGCTKFVGVFPLTFLRFYKPY